MDILLRELQSRNVKKVVEENFSYWELDCPEDFLNFCINNGYVLHGSTRKIIGNLKPNRAYDLSKDFGNQTAIYLTKTPLIAMFVALTGGAKGISKRRNSVSSVWENGVIKYKDVFFGVSNTDKIKNKGFVYVFYDAVIDGAEGSEYIARKEIAPELVIQVKREDFNFPIETLE